VFGPFFGFSTPFSHHVYNIDSEMNLKNYVHKEIRFICAPVNGEAYEEKVLPSMRYAFFVVSHKSQDWGWLVAVRRSP
jgi:hypothetical protein